MSSELAWVCGVVVGGVAGTLAMGLVMMGRGEPKPTATGGPLIACPRCKTTHSWRGCPDFEYTKIRHCHNCGRMHAREDCP